MYEPKHHVKVGKICLSPRGIGDDIYIDLDGWYEMIDQTKLCAILEAIGEKIERHSASSWENDGWRIDKENKSIIFEILVGSATPDPKWYRQTVKINDFLAAVEQIKCPFPDESKSDKNHELKRCDGCWFYNDDQGYCMHDHDSMNPLVKMLKEGARKYIQDEIVHEPDYACITAGLRFRVLRPKDNIPTKWKSLQLGLGHSRNKIDDCHFEKTWKHTGGVHHSVTLHPEDYTGVIIAKESHEISCADDWYMAQTEIINKRYIVGKVFGEICQHVYGDVEPIAVLTRKTMKEQAEPVVSR